MIIYLHCRYKRHSHDIIGTKFFQQISEQQVTVSQEKCLNVGL